MKGVIRICKLMKDRQHSGKMKKRQTMISTTLSNKTRNTQETGAKSEHSEGLEVSTVLNNTTY